MIWLKRYCAVCHNYKRLVRCTPVYRIIEENGKLDSECLWICRFHYLLTRLRLINPFKLIRM